MKSADAQLIRQLFTLMQLKNKSGLKIKFTLILIKIIAFVVILFVIEQFFHWCINKNIHQDPLGIALLPFHNNYLVFSKYFITDQGLSFSDLTNAPSATFRFVLSAFLGFIICSVVGFLTLLPGIRKYADKIIPLLYYSMFLYTFLLAFFFPSRKTVLDVDSKDIAITTYNHLLIPSTVHIPFSAAECAYCKYKYDYFEGTHTYRMEMRLKTLEGSDIRLGETEIESQKEHKLSPEAAARFERILTLLNHTLKEGPRPPPAKIPGPPVSIGPTLDCPLLSLHSQ